MILSPNPSPIDGADHVLSSHDPIALVRTLRKMFNLATDPASIETATEVLSPPD